MRSARANKIDTNQPEIVQTFRELGATVTLLNKVGDGCQTSLSGIAIAAIL